MISTRRSLFALAISMAALAPAARAQVFNFDNLKYNAPSLPGFSGFLPADTGWFCTGGDKCSSNVNGGFLGGDLKYVSSGLMVTATGWYKPGSGPATQGSVVQDHENGYNGPRYNTGSIGAGLGVYHKTGDNSDDNITIGEYLKLSFGNAVTLDWIGLRSDGHNTTGWIPNATFDYSLDGTTWTSALLPTNVGKYNLGLVSQDFYFRYGGSTPDQFYLSAASATPVPEPASITLVALGLAGLGLVARRRRSA